MNSLHPEVSIILPTYNRSDTILRAINSVIMQTFLDWELIVTDDGSTDSTSQLLVGLDPRIHVIKQDNQGISAARNTGLLASKGKYIAFLDSDDEWLPHFLDLSIGFLRNFPDEHFVTLEFLKEDSDERMINGSIKVYHSIARLLGSRSLDLPPGESDNYLRFYPSKKSIGRWGTKFLTDEAVTAFHLYHGHIFPKGRWGYLSWLPATVLTRHALETVGYFDPSARTASDYTFHLLLHRHFRANFISVPSARKHELGLNAVPVKQDHLAGGSNNFNFRMKRLQYFDQLLWLNNQHDFELMLIRKFYVYKAAWEAMRGGLRNDSIRLFREAACLRPPFWKAYFLCAISYFFVPHRMSSKFYRLFCRLFYIKLVTDSN
jgi:glycosyltransferase involved in cell wall biosynthesis